MSNNSYGPKSMNYADDKPASNPASEEMFNRDKVLPPDPPRAATKSGDPKAAYATTKPALHLNPPAGAVHQSCSMLNGAIKYGPFNWREGDGVEVMTYVGAMKRHIEQFVDGENTETDPVTGITFHHLAAVMATAAIVLDALECGKLVDNRPPKGAASALLQRLTIKKEKPSGV